VQVAPSWKLLGGVRYDSFKGDFQTLTYSNTTGLVTASPTAHISNSPWSYRGGVLFQPSATASFHASYGTSFNTAADTYQYVTQQTANTPPEKSRNIEIGAKLDWFDNRLSTRVAIFRTDKYNERTTDADFAGTSFLLSGQRHTQGIEVDIAGKLTDQVELYVSASYTPTAIIDRIGSAQANVVGQRVGLVPRTSGGVYLTYTPFENLRFGAGVHGASKNYALQGTSGAAQNTNRAPGYAVTDLLAEYKFTPDLFAQVNVFNIANKLYADQLYPGFTTAGAPRSVQLTVGARF
jgi:catecholate siderophore receptor